MTAGIFDISLLTFYSMPNVKTFLHKTSFKCKIEKNEYNLEILIILISNYSTWQIKQEKNTAAIFNILLLTSCWIRLLE